MGSSQSIEASCCECNASFLIPARSYQEQNGLVYCDSCGVLTSCSRCARKIHVLKSEYQRSSGQVYCENCLVPFTCASCGEQKVTTPEKASNNRSLTCKDCPDRSVPSPEPNGGIQITGISQCTICKEDSRNLTEFREAPGEPVCQSCVPVARGVLNEIQQGIATTVVAGVGYLIAMTIFFAGAIGFSLFLVSSFELDWWMFFVLTGITLLGGAHWSQIFEPREVIDLGYASLMMFGAVWVWSGGINPEKVTLLAIVLVSALIIHEISHKAIGLAFGQPAEFKAFYTLNLIAVAFASVAPFFILMPGAVHNKTITQRAHGIIAAAGPVSNLILVLLFSRMGGSHPEIAFIGALANLGIAGFNMLPIPPFDGSNVWQWSPAAYGVIVGTVAVFAYNLIIPLI